MNTIKRFFGRKWQVFAFIAFGVSIAYLTPRDMSMLHWAAYVLCFIAFLVNGLDHYAEGIEKGIKIMDKIG
ncbi:hypothetical protein [Flavobacterium sp.]|jgi:hypothetical protein|uniref:hypothetical protein n=1 Tax=Flavobacterium sp. TaxID=239 RepID=UPI0037BFE4DA